MEDIMHFVDFETYCASCAHKDVKEEDSPCDECLKVPARENSRKPERWEKR